MLIIERYLVIKLEIDERGSGFGLLLDLNLMQKNASAKVARHADMGMHLV